jgi:hypothetical protein
MPALYRSKKSRITPSQYPCNHSRHNLTSLFALDDLEITKSDPSHMRRTGDQRITVTPCSALHLYCRLHFCLPPPRSRRRVTGHRATQTSNAPSGPPMHLHLRRPMRLEPCMASNFFIDRPDSTAVSHATAGNSRSREPHRHC